jgi:hypothetical protein
MHEPELNLLFFALVFGPQINTDGQWQPSCHRTFNCVLETFRESSILDSYLEVRGLDRAACAPARSSNVEDWAVVVESGL